MKVLEFESEIIIDKPVEVIFQFLSKQENHKHIFKANISCQQITDGPLRLGTKVVNTASFLGSKMTEHFEIIGFEENKSIRKKTLPNSTHQSEDCFTLTAIDKNQTKVELYLIAWPTGVLKYVLPLVKPLFIGRVKKDLLDFKNYMESH